MPQLGQLTRLLERWFPPGTAADWDAVGLVWGDPETSVSKVMFAIDPTLAVAEEAATWGADLLVVHHPLFLTPVHSMAKTNPKGRVVAALASAGCALFTAHTNADSALGGVSEALALAVGLGELQAIVPTDQQAPDSAPTGMGRIGTVPITTLRQFASAVAAALPATASGVRVSGDPDRVVRRVAVCGGSGDFLLDELVDQDIDVYLTSDLRHHRAAEFREHDGPALIDVAHWAAEWTWLPVVAQRLETSLNVPGRDDTVATRVSLTPTDPWTFRI